jgi:hypothetical protein
MSAGAPIILIEIFCGFPQSLKANSRTVQQAMITFSRILSYHSILNNRNMSYSTFKAASTRAHEVRPLQRTCFMTDVAEDTTELQNAVRSFLSALEPEESVAFASRLFLQRTSRRSLQGTHFVRSCRRCLIVCDVTPCNLVEVSRNVLPPFKCQGLSHAIN